MRVLLLVAAFQASLAAQPVLYTCGATTANYWVGAKLPPSGLFRRAAPGKWEQLGFNHPGVFAFAGDPADPSILYLAAGNGVIRAASGGRKWTILTDHTTAETRDLAVDPHASGALLFAHTAGIRATRDGGASWRELSGGLHRHYNECVRLDPRRAGVLLAGGEEGIFRSEDSGATWRLAGAAGFQIMRIEASPHDPCFWLAATQKGGLFASRDCGSTFESSGRLGVDRNLYDIAFDPTDPARIAVAGWGPGVAVSIDGAKTWQLRSAGLSRPEITSLAFDPSAAGRLYVAVADDGIWVSPDSGLTWKKDGLDGWRASLIRFLPEGRP